MSDALVVQLVRHAMVICLLVAAPLLVTELIVGVTVSVIQAVTQVQEQTLTFVPKLVAVAVVLVLFLPWMLGVLVDYVAGTIRSLPMLSQ